MVSLLIASDICPTAPDEALFRAGQVDALLNDYAGLWSRVDASILNLECPLTEGEDRIRKIGPHLKASPECVAFLRNARISAVCLANNHIRDYGDRGVTDTLKACREAGIPTLGAGVSLEEARVPLTLTVQGLRLGILAMAEWEFNIASQDCAGANPIDYRNFTLLRELKSQVDFVLVLLHAGTEMFPYPRPGLVELCRFLADQGADAVIVQHTHCVGCHEVYRHAPIIYGQGNGIFAATDTPVGRMDPAWFEGLLVELRLKAGEPCQVAVHPYEQSRGFAGLRALQGTARERLLASYEERSRVLRDPRALQAVWRTYGRQQQSSILPRSLGISGLLASLVYRARLAGLIEACTDTDLRWHMMTCESHRELVADCLQEKNRP